MVGQQRRRATRRIVRRATLRDGPALPRAPFGFGSGSQGLVSTEAGTKLAVVQHPDLALEALAHAQRIDNRTRSLSPSRCSSERISPWKSGAPEP